MPSAGDIANFLFNPVVPIDTSVSLIFDDAGKDKELAQKNKAAAEAAKKKAQADAYAKETEGKNVEEAAKKTLEVLFLALPKAAWASTTCLADKVGWVTMAATFAASYASGNWAPWVALVKPHACECAVVPHLNIIPKTGVTAGLYAAAAAGAEAGCAKFGQSIYKDAGCACKDAEYQELLSLPHIKADPAICGMDCATLSANLTSALVGDTGAKVQAAAGAANGQTIAIAALAWLLLRKGA